MAAWNRRDGCFVVTGMFMCVGLVLLQAPPMLLLGRRHCCSMLLLGCNILKPRCSLQSRRNRARNRARCRARRRARHRARR